MAAQTNNDKSKKPSSNIPDRDPIQVYCRLRPLDSPDDEYCITVKSSNSLTIYTPECCSNKDPKESTFTFEKVYNWMTPQKTIFDEIARPLIQVWRECSSKIEVIVHLICTDLGIAGREECPAVCIWCHQLWKDIHHVRDSVRSWHHSSCL